MTTRVLIQSAQNLMQPFSHPIDTSRRILARLANWFEVSKVTGQIWLELKLVRDFMPVMVSCKFDEGPIID